MELYENGKYIGTFHNIDENYQASVIDTHNFICKHVKKHLWDWSWNNWQARIILNHASEHIWNRLFK